MIFMFLLFDVSRISLLIDGHDVTMWSHWFCGSSSFVFVCTLCFTVFWYSILLVVFSGLLMLIFGLDVVVFCFLHHLLFIITLFQVCNMCIFLDLHISVSFEQHLGVYILLLHSQFVFYRDIFIDFHHGHLQRSSFLAKSKLFSVPVYAWI